MNEPAIEALDGTPLKPLLDGIAALKGKADLAPFLADEHPSAHGFLFRFGSDQDYGDATRVIPATAAGTGVFITQRPFTASW